jgi:hypothetical protein
MDNSIDRILVNISEEVRDDFDRRGKVYELRDYAGQFTEENVYFDKRVELKSDSRKGSLWGLIGKVYIGPVDLIFEQVGDYKLISPRAESPEWALSNAKVAAKDPEMCIAFEVILDKKRLMS